MSDGPHSVELSAMVFHGALGFVDLAEAAVLYGVIRLIRLWAGQWAETPEMAWHLAAAEYLGWIAVGLILVAAGYHFVCANVHRRAAKDRA